MQRGHWDQTKEPGNQYSEGRFRVDGALSLRAWICHRVSDFDVERFRISVFRIPYSDIYHSTHFIIITIIYSSIRSSSSIPVVASRLTLPPRRWRRPGRAETFAVPCVWIACDTKDHYLQFFWHSQLFNGTDISVIRHHHRTIRTKRSWNWQCKLTHEI